MSKGTQGLIHLNWHKVGKSDNMNSKKRSVRQIMGAIVTIHHPILTEEEREIRIERIKQAAVEFYKEVQRCKAKQEASTQATNIDN